MVHSQQCNNELPAVYIPLAPSIKQIGRSASGKEQDNKLSVLPRRREAEDKSQHLSAVGSQFYEECRDGYARQAAFLSQHLNQPLGHLWQSTRVSRGLPGRRACYSM
jgi:hypothetical protein